MEGLERSHPSQLVPVGCLILGVARRERAAKAGSRVGRVARDFQGSGAHSAAGYTALDGRRVSDFRREYRVIQPTERDRL